MVQQIANTRTDKQLTLNDLARITYASCLNLFHTNTMFTPWPFGISFSINFYHYKRLSSDSYQWQGAGASTEQGTYPLNIWKGGNAIRTLNKSQVVNHHPDLVCDRDGDERLYIDCAYRRMPNFDKSKIGLYILDPQLVKGGLYIGHIYPALLYYKIVITPKPGLFPVKK